ncbi:hypothetical protein C8R42DRAFT_637403 [Lentinula raphanica]|nr:hypothetical protein C8R42DRAFT_637403 [Lentinula raphanica]
MTLMKKNTQKLDTGIGLGPRPAPPPSSMTPGGSRVQKDEIDLTTDAVVRTRAQSRNFAKILNPNPPAGSRSARLKSLSSPSSPSPSPQKQSRMTITQAADVEPSEGGASKHASAEDDPSLSPLSSVSTLTQGLQDKGKGVQNDPIPSATRQRSETIASNESLDLYPRILSERSFVTARDEPLSASCLKLHPVFNPLDSDDDPLKPFGVESGGLIPGHDLESTDMLRDAVIRWTYPTITEFPFGMYECLRDFAAKLPELSITESDFEKVGGRKDPTSQANWALSRPHLNSLTHAALGLNQVLRALEKFRDPLIKQYFILDPKFRFVQMLEGPKDLDILIAAVEGLKIRGRQAYTRVNDLFRLIKFELGILHTDSESNSEAGGTAFSTVSEVRDQFGQDSGPVELGKLLMRPEYAKAAIRANLTPQVIFERFENPSQPVPQVIYRPSHHPFPSSFLSHRAQDTVKLL